MIASFELMRPSKAKGTLIKTIRMLDRASNLDKQVTERILDAIPIVNEMQALNVSDLRLLLRFFDRRQHIIAVRTKGQRLVTELANARLMDNL